MSYFLLNYDGPFFIFLCYILGSYVEFSSHTWNWPIAVPQLADCSDSRLMTKCLTPNLVKIQKNNSSKRHVDITTVPRYLELHDQPETLYELKQSSLCAFMAQSVCCLHILFPCSSTKCQDRNVHILSIYARAYPAQIWEIHYFHYYLLEAFLFLNRDDW